MGMNIPNMGMHNTNQLVHNQLGLQSFEVVRNIYDNLDWLYQIHSELNKLSVIFNNLPYLNNSLHLLEDIKIIRNNISNVVEVSRNLNFLRDFLPVLQNFKKDVDTLIDKCEQNRLTLTNFELRYQNIETELTRLNTRLVTELKVNLEEYLLNTKNEFNEILCKVIKEKEEVENLYKQIKKFVPFYEQTVKNQNDINKELAHLSASNAVSDALFLKDEHSKKRALNYIKASEALGNNEVVNREKLNISVDRLNILEILKNNPNLSVDNVNTYNDVLKQLFNLKPNDNSGTGSVNSNCGCKL